MLQFIIKLLLIAISLTTIAAYPQNKNGCNIENNNNRNVENSELNENKMKCSNTVQFNGNESDKTKDGTFLHLTNIFAGHEPDLTFLNIPYKNKEKSIEILTKATKSMNNNETYIQNSNDNNYDLNNTQKIENKLNNRFLNKTDNTKVSAINSGELNFDIHKNDLRILNIPYKTNDKTIEILNSIKFNNENNNENVTEINLREMNNENVLNKTFNINDTTEINTKTQSNTTTDNSEIFLSEITNLSLDGVEEGSVMGQKIQIQRSAINSDIEENSNSAGGEILRNITNYCGTLFGKRISFANETSLMEFPWTVLLLYNTHTRYHCGGSLITKKYVLTAAHCVAQDFYELSGVRLGEYDISEDPDCAKDIGGDDICATTIDVDVVKIIIHHAYSQLSFRNDIALLKLDNEYIGRSYYPICLPTPDKILEETKATVAGWGATHKAIRSAKLLKAEVPIIDMSKCREIYRHSEFNDTTEICGSGVNEVDVCKGDSGGALFYSAHIKGKDIYYQLGIVSLGVRRCGDERFLPAVFTKIKGYYKWIENNLEY